jgi:hypothetical protein
VETNAQIVKMSSDVWSLVIHVTKELATPYIDGKNRRVICTCNGVSFQGALMPMGDGSYFINLNQKRAKKMGVSEGDEVWIDLEKDNSKYGLPVPKEFEEALNLDSEAEQLFHKLTMGKQRSLIHVVGTVKSTDKRIHKSLVILEYLKSVNGKLDFKELNQAFKDANQKRL